MPKLTLLRVAVSAGTAAAGYVGFKVEEGRRWMDEKVQLLNNIFSKFSLPPRQHKEVNMPDNTVQYSNTQESKTEENVVNNAVEYNNTEQGHFTGFIKKMIEIDEMLRSGDFDGQEGLSLPRIVVVGSQSAGKSSVLESIVGHSFLPKGSNMVTRRPLLLTLVNDPSCIHDFAVFPTPQGAVKLSDFKKVAERVKELNDAVPEEEWVSEIPVELHIHSRHLPDLTLIDLPGYIAVNNRHQPAILRQRIVDLCDQFLLEPNIILAVSAADVDLANSEALQAARRHDPAGSRTIGVVTKLDLVSAEHGASVLKNDDYPLTMGYVGVICSDGSDNSRLKTLTEYEDTVTGIDALKSKLVTALQSSLQKCTRSVLSRVNEELGEIRYELKTKYDDKTITAEGYLAQVVALVREGVERVSASFTRASVRHILERDLIDRHLIDILLQECDDSVSRPKLHHLTALLTRAGWGRQCAHQVATELINEIKRTVQEQNGPLCHHPTTTDALLSALDSSCRSRIVACAEQVENALQPFKQPDSLEFTEDDWQRSRVSLIRLLDSHKQSIILDINSAVQSVGGQDRLKRVMEKLGKNEHVSVLDQDAANEVLYLWHRQKRLDTILSRLHQDQCKHTTIYSRFWSLFNPPPIVLTTDDCQLKCPWVYLYMVSRVVLSQAALYTQDELVPDQRLRLADLLLSRDPTQFARENAVVWRHLELLSRQSVLERVRERLLYANSGSTPY